MNLKHARHFTLFFVCAYLLWAWGLYAGLGGCASQQKVSSGDRIVDLPKPIASTQPDHVADARKMVIEQDQANVMTKAQVDAVLQTEISARVDAKLLDYRKTVNYNLSGGALALVLLFLYSWWTSYERARGRRIRKQAKVANKV